MINWQDYEGRQPLHCAVTDSTDAVVAAIIKYSFIRAKKKNNHISLRSPSCMLNALDNRLRSALHWAALVGRPSLVQMLLDRGAKALKSYFMSLLTFFARLTCWMRLERVQFIWEFSQAAQTLWGLLWQQVLETKIDEPKLKPTSPY